MKSRLLPTMLALGLSLAIEIQSAPSTASDCCSAPTSTPGGNFATFVPDSISTCAGGDSLALTTGLPRPTRVRATILYEDASGSPKVGVPPESLWVELSTVSGTIVAFDEGPRTYADDSTDSNGRARFTIPSLGGCGVLGLEFFVSGTSKGSTSIKVRTVDTNGDGTVNTADWSSPCDVDYNSQFDVYDRGYVAQHYDHFHRNALHGTLVRRTNLCGTCDPETENTLGDSKVSWSADGKYLAFSHFIRSTADCAIHIVPSNPHNGHTVRQFSFPDTFVHDYDPDWSPVGSVIAFDRADNTIYRKPSSSTSGTDTTLITTYDNGQFDPVGDIMPAYSPNGQWVAFCRKADVNSGFRLWKIPMEGMLAGASATQLTTGAAGDDLYPRWSADGTRIYFERFVPATNLRRVYFVSSNGGALDSLVAVAGVHSTMPDVSPDGKILVAGVGEPEALMTTWTLDPLLSTQSDLTKAVENFGEFGALDIIDESEFTILSPRISPDGTRLAMRAIPPNAPTELPQIWASRRNMNLPPSLTTIGGVAVVDSTPSVQILAQRDSLISLSVAGTDPESDALTFRALFMRPSMSFNSTTRTFEWTPSTSQLDSTYFVRFQVETESGGVDYGIAAITVVDTIPPSPSNDFAADLVGSTVVTFGWTAPGDDKMSGSASTYDLRWSTAAIDASNFYLASQVSNNAAPSPPDDSGETEYYQKNGLSPNTWYWFALKTEDARDNASALTVISVKTTGGGGGLSAMQVPIDESGGAAAEPTASSDEREAGALAGSPGQGWSLAVEKSEGGGVWRVYAVEEESVPTTIRHQERDWGEAWVTALETDLGQTGAWGVRMPRSTEARILFPGTFEVSHVVGALLPSVGAGATSLLAEAVHSTFGDLTESWAGAGGGDVAMGSGDTLAIAYEAGSLGEYVGEDLVFVISNPSAGVGQSHMRREMGPGLPNHFALAQNQPNPFASATTIRFDLPKGEQVRLEIFDAQGRRVARLANGWYPAGFHAVEWDRRGEGGRLQPGVYLYRIQAGQFRNQKKLVLLP